MIPSARASCLLVAGLVLALVVLSVSSARASSVQPVGPTASSGCQPSGLFGTVAPEGNALVGITYADPETGNDCVLGPGAVLPGDVFKVWLYTPTTPTNGTVPIGIEEFRWGTQTVYSPGPNNTTIATQVRVQQDVLWSNASVGAIARQFQQFNLQVPPVFVSPADAANLAVSILGLQMQFRIATPGTSIVVPLTVGSLIGWLAVMSPVAVVAFVSGFGPGELVARRLRYVSTGRWAGFLAFSLTLLIVLGVVGNFTGFLYWLGSVGILGLALLLLLPTFAWGSALWISVRGRRLKARLIRAPIAKSDRGEPVVGTTAIKIYGGGDTGHEPELVEGLGVGGLRAAWHRFLGLRIKWRADRIAREPVFIKYDWSKGRMDIEGEYAAWPNGGGLQLDYSLRREEIVWFPWRKSVKARFDPVEAPPSGAAPGGGAAPPPPAPGNDGVRDPALWAHRGFFLGLRHGEATASVLGRPDFVGPDQYVRGLAPARSFALESQRRGTALTLLYERVGAEAEERAHELVAIRDRLQAFPGSPESMEGLRSLSTRLMGSLFDTDQFLARLEDRGRNRVDYRPPGAKEYSVKTSTITTEALEPRPPELRGGNGRRA